MEGGEGGTSVAVKMCCCVVVTWVFTASSRYQVAIDRFASLRGINCFGIDSLDSEGQRVI